MYFPGINLTTQLAITLHDIIETFLIHNKNGNYFSIL